MPAPGTLAALKDLFSALRTVSVDTALRPADQGRIILVNDAAPVTITLPAIGGNVGAGVNALGQGWAVALLNVGAGGTLVASADTFNGGSAFGPISLGAVNDWLIAVAPPSGVDWAIMGSLPGAL